MSLTRRSLFASALALLALPRKVAGQRLLAALIPSGRPSVLAADWGHNHGQVVWVGDGEQFATLADAWPSVRPGATIFIKPAHQERITLPGHLHHVTIRPGARGT